MGLYLKDNTDKIKLLAGGATRTWVGTYDAYLEAKDSIPDSTVIMITDKEADYDSDIPVGTILQYKGDTAPDGWLFTDGSTFDETAYPVLYSLLGSNELPEYFDGEPEIGASISQTITASQTGSQYDFTAEHNGVLIAHMEATNSTQTFGMIRITDTTTGVIHDSKGALTQYPVWSTTCPLKKGHKYSIWYRNDASGTKYIAWRRIGYSTTEPRIIKAVDGAATVDFNTKQTSAIINTSVDKAKDYTRRRKGEFTYTTNSRFNAPQNVHVWQEGSSVHIQMNFTNKATGNNTWIEHGTITGVDLPTGTRWCGIAESGGVAWPVRVTADGKVQIFAGGTLLANNTTGVQACYYADGIDEE